MKSIKVKVSLKGLVPIMFDRYSGDNKTQLLPEQKLYLDEDNGLIMPAANIHSFLCALNTKSAAKMFYDPRKYKIVAGAILGFVTINPFQIPIICDGVQAKWEGWDKNGIWLHKSVARLDKGIPNPKERPVLNCPWQIDFNINIFENSEVGEIDVKNLFHKGGIAIGLGTYRGVFGKFVVDVWDRI